MIAIGMLSVACLGTMAALSFGLRAQNIGTRNDEAIGWGRKIIELIRIRNWAWNTIDTPSGCNVTDPLTSTLGGFSVAQPGVPLNTDNTGADFSSVIDAKSSINMRRRIIVGRVAGSGYLNNVARVGVAIYYWDNNKEFVSTAAAAGKGKWREVYMEAWHCEP